MIRPEYLDRYSRLDSPVHRLPAWLKLLTALVLVVITVVTPFHWEWIAGVTLALVIAAALSFVPASFLLRRLLLMEPLVIGIAAVALFQPNGFELFLKLIARSTVCLGLMVLVSSTTPYGQFLDVMRRVRFPALFVTTFALMYRYLFVLLDETERMRRARQSRMLAPNRRQTWQSLGTLIGQLFVRSTERAERIYAAMCARGWK
jgi:cobalt/nickel transport system permease protein